MDASMLDAKQQFILQSVSLRPPSIAYAKEIYSNMVKRNLLLLPRMESRVAVQGTHRAFLRDRIHSGATGVHGNCMV
jgi:hypothetical protein